MNRTTLALIESATQLLNLAEWAYATCETDDVEVAVLAPPDPQTVHQIGQVSELLGEFGIPIRMLPVRTRTPAALTGTVQALRGLARARRLVIGDPFSRFIQTLLPAATATQVVIVDDGTATWEYAACIDAGRPLVRWDVAPGRIEARAVRARRLLSPSSRRQVTVFSCLSSSTPRAATGLVNRYAWTRAWRRPVIESDRTDVLGVSLVDTGIVARAPYVAAVRELAQDNGPIRYLAHRRESAGLLAEIAALSGVEVSRAELPAELALRAGPVAGRIITFPSTATHTLPIVLGDLAVHVDVRPVEPSWYLPSATERTRAFLSRIADRAPSCAALRP